MGVAPRCWRDGAGLASAAVIFTLVPATFGFLVSVATFLAQVAFVVWLWVRVRASRLRAVLWLTVVLGLGFAAWLADHAIYLLMNVGFLGGFSYGTYDLNGPMLLYLAVTALSGIAKLVLSIAFLGGVVLLVTETPPAEDGKLPEF